MTNPTPTDRSEGENLTPYQLKRKQMKEERQAMTEPWLNKNIRFEHPFLDVDNAWRILGNSNPDNHHEKCSWRTNRMLCDCACSEVAENVVKQAYDLLAAARREEREKAAKVIRSIHSTVTEEEVHYEDQPGWELCDSQYDQALNKAADDFLAEGRGKV